MKKPKCIVMPFREANASGIGLSLHFLLGNVIAVHTGFAECWFGWRVGKIFRSSESLSNYIRMQGAAIDRKKICDEQKIRCWIFGQMEDETARLSLFDRGKSMQAAPESFTFTVRDDLIGFRKQFIEWLGRCGLPMENHRRPMALWPERTSLQGLLRIGQALRHFYIHSAYGGQSRIDLSLFETAVTAAPESFMANNLCGWAHYRHQDARSARRFFDRALGLNPNSPGATAGHMGCAILEKDVEATVHWAVRKAELVEQDVAAVAGKARKRFE